MVIFITKTHINYHWFFFFPELKRNQLSTNKTNADWIFSFFFLFVFSFYERTNSTGFTILLKSNTQSIVNILSEPCAATSWSAWSPASTGGGRKGVNLCPIVVINLYIYLLLIELICLCHFVVHCLQFILKYCGNENGMYYIRRKYSNIDTPYVEIKPRVACTRCHVI